MACWLEKFNFPYTSQKRWCQQMQKQQNNCINLPSQQNPATHHQWKTSSYPWSRASSRTGWIRRGRGTRDQIRHILEKCTEFNRKIYFCFIDYAKAFDCFRHSALWKALLEMTTSKPVFEQRRVTRTGSISAGVLDKVVSYLLHSSTCMQEYIMRRVLENWNGGLSIGGYKLSNLRYADDTTLVATGALELEELLLIVKAKSEALGLRLSVSKTKIMIVGSDGNEDPIVVDGTEVEHVTQFNFLGSLITTSSGCSTELRRRMTMAKSAMVGMNKSGLTEASPKQRKSAWSLR